MTEVRFMARVANENKIVATATLRTFPREGDFVTFPIDGKALSYRVTAVEWQMNHNRVSVDVWLAYSSGG